MGGHPLGHHVVDRVEVESVAEVLVGVETAAGLESAFEQEHTLAGPGEVGGADEAVRARRRSRWRRRCSGAVISRLRTAASSAATSRRTPAFERDASEVLEEPHHRLRAPPLGVAAAEIFGHLHGGEVAGREMRGAVGMDRVRQIEPREEAARSAADDDPGSGRFIPYCSGMALPPIMFPRTAEGLLFSWSQRRVDVALEDEVS